MEVVVAKHHQLYLVIPSSLEEFVRPDDNWLAQPFHPGCSGSAMTLQRL